jgi:hypothetical protein
MEYDTNDISALFTDAAIENDDTDVEMLSWMLSTFGDAGTSANELPEGSWLATIGSSLLLGRLCSLYRQKGKRRHKTVYAGDPLSYVQLESTDSGRSSDEMRVQHRFSELLDILGGCYALGIESTVTAL